MEDRWNSIETWIAITNASCLTCKSLILYIMTLCECSLVLILGQRWRKHISPPSIYHICGSGQCSTFWRHLISADLDRRTCQAQQMKDSISTTTIRYVTLCEILSSTWNSGCSGRQFKLAWWERQTREILSFSLSLFISIHLMLRDTNLRDTTLCRNGVLLVESLRLELKQSKRPDRLLARYRA